MLPIMTVKQIVLRFGEVSEFVASGVEGGQRHRETVLAERKRVGAGIKHNASLHASVADFIRKPVHVAEIVDPDKGACLMNYPFLNSRKVYHNIRENATRTSAKSIFHIPHGGWRSNGTSRRSD